VKKLVQNFWEGMGCDASENHNFARGSKDPNLEQSDERTYIYSIYVIYI